jgi:hypothetical protein
MTRATGHWGECRSYSVIGMRTHHQMLRERNAGTICPRFLLRSIRYDLLTKGGRTVSNAAYQPVREMLASLSLRAPFSASRRRNHNEASSTCRLGKQVPFTHLTVSVRGKHL